MSKTLDALIATSYDNGRSDGKRLRTDQVVVILQKMRAEQERFKLDGWETAVDVLTFAILRVSELT